jgi:hypothetical protein
MRKVPSTAKIKWLRWLVLFRHFAYRILICTNVIWCNDGNSAISRDRLNETEETCKTMQFVISRILRKPSSQLVLSLPTISLANTHDLRLHTSVACRLFSEIFIFPVSQGEKGEAEAYCYHFREEGSLKNLRQVWLALKYFP